MALTKVTAGLITANAVVDSFGTQSITGDKLGLTAINANNIVDGAITGPKLGTNSVSSNNIVSVSNTAITGNIASSQIAPNQVFYGNVDIGLALTSNNTNTLSVGGDVELQKTVTSDGDSLGKLVFWNNTNAGAGSGTSFIRDVAYIKGVMDGTGNNSGGRLEFYTKADGQSSVKAMNIDGAGRITIPNQPSFWTCVLGDDTYSGVGWSKVRLTSGQSSAFGESYISFANHRFTAPVAGKYFFSAAVTMTGSNNTDGTIGFTKNGAGNPANGRSTAYASSVGLGGMDVAHVMDLAANDYIEVFIYQSGTQTTRNTQYAGYFSGWLIG